MTTLLLIVIYITFIGLGIPDSLFGAAWPAIYTEFSLPISLGSCITILISITTMTSSLMSARLITRFGTPRVTAVSTALTAIGLLGFSLSGRFVFLLISAIPMGFGAGAIDSGLNNYVALHYKANHMSFLHCFYGIGVTISPYLMSVALGGEGGWRGGYRITFFIQLFVTAVTLISLPLWKKVGSRGMAGVGNLDEADIEFRTLKMSEMAKMPKVRAVWLLFLASTTIEFTTGVWGSTFLVNSRGMTAENAARIITFYYGGMALGRFISGILASRVSSWKIVKIGVCVLGAALILMFFPVGKISGAALFLVGLGNGPFYPNLTHLTPTNFGADISQSVMGSQMASACIGTIILTPLFGVLAQNIGTGFFPVYLVIMYCLMIVYLIRMTSLLKKENRYAG